MYLVREGGRLMLKYVIKRDGRITNFDVEKIIDAIDNAFLEVDGELTKDSEKLSRRIAESISKMRKLKANVEEIQDEVERKLMASPRKDVAKAYITYRNMRTEARGNTIDKVVEEIVKNTNDYWKSENSNKNSQLVTTMRDYVAGAVSSDISRRKLIPKEVIEAHDKGILHFHDIDYFLQPMHNCCLINLEDMLQNGTIISKTKIDKPHRFSTACNIATQIIAQVASSQYGGQSISIAHLSPFVESSREIITKEVEEEFKDVEFDSEESKKSVIENAIEKRLQRDIEAGIQTLQYQIVTLMTTNGQAPFITVFLALDEAEEGQSRDDLARVIEEVLKQRIKGVKNEKGVYVTVAFPKLIYALGENNTYEGSKYFWLTKLAAECSAKRMVPDYISEKVIRELKQGDLYPAMGLKYC